MANNNAIQHMNTNTNTTAIASSVFPSDSRASSASSSPLTAYRRVTSNEEITQCTAWCIEHRAWKLHAHLNELLTTGRISSDQGFSHVATPLLYVNSTPTGSPVPSADKIQLQVEVVLLIYGSGDIEAVIERARRLPLQQSQETSVEQHKEWHQDDTAFYVAFETTRSDESIHQLKIMLQELLPTHERFYFSGVSDQYDDMIQDLAMSHHATLEWDRASEWCATSASRAAAIARQNGNTLGSTASHPSSSSQLVVGSLRVEHVDLVVRNWPYAAHSTPALIQHIIETGQTSCVYQEGKPVSYCLQQQYGAIGMLFTDPACRHQGLASKCVGALSEQILQHSHPHRTLFAHISDGNTESERVFAKQGFNKVSKIRWILWNPASGAKGQEIPQKSDDRHSAASSSQPPPFQEKKNNVVKPVMNENQKNIVDHHVKRLKQNKGANSGVEQLEAITQKLGKNLKDAATAIKTKCNFALHPSKCRYGTKCKYAASHVQTPTAAATNSTSSEPPSAAPPIGVLSASSISSAHESRNKAETKQKQQKQPKKPQTFAALPATTASSTPIAVVSSLESKSSQPPPIQQNATAEEPTAKESSHAAKVASRLAEKEESQRKFTQDILDASALNEQYHFSLLQMQEKTNHIIEEVQQKPQTELSLLEKSPAVVRDLIFSVLDVQSLLSVAKSSKSLWVSIATRGEMWRMCAVAVAPPRYRLTIGSQGWNSNLNLGVWSIFGRFGGLSVQWPPSLSESCWGPTDERRSQIVSELRNFFKLTPLLQPSISSKHSGMSLDLSAKTVDPTSRDASSLRVGRYVLVDREAAHVLLESELMWESVFASHLAQGIGELYLGDVTVKVHMMRVLSDLPLLHTLSITDVSLNLTAETSLLQYLPNMKRLKSLQYTGHISHPLKSPTCRFIAACTTLQRLHLRLLSKLSQQHYDWHWFMQFSNSLASSQISELGIELTNLRSSFAQGDALDLLARIEDQLSSSSSSTPADFAQLPVPKVLHLFNVGWPTTETSNQLAAMLDQVMRRNSIEEANEQDSVPQRRELHLHLSDSGRSLHLDFQLRDVVSLAQNLRIIMRAATQSNCQIHMYVPNGSAPLRVPEHLQIREWQQVRSLYFPSPLEATASEVAREPASQGLLHIWDHPLLPRSFLRGTWQGPGRAIADQYEMKQNRPRMIQQLASDGSVLWKCYLQEVAERKKREDQLAYKKALQARVNELCSKLNDDGSASRLDSVIVSFSTHMLVPKIAVQCCADDDHRLSFSLNERVTLFELRSLLSEVTGLSTERLELRILNPPQAPLTEEHDFLTLSDLQFQGRTVSLFPSIKHMIPKPSSAALSYNAAMIQMDIKKLVSSYPSIAATLRNHRLTLLQQGDVAIQLLRSSLLSDRLLCLLQCLIYDEVLTSESLVTSLRKTRALINVEQRSPSIRKDIQYGVATNQHIRLSEHIRLFRQYRSSLGLSEKELDTILDLEEVLPQIKDARLDKIAFERMKQQRSSAEQWRTYETLSTTISQPEYRSRNRIFHTNGSSLSTLLSSESPQPTQLSAASSSSSATNPSHAHLLDVFNRKWRSLPVVTLKLIHSILEKLRGDSSEESPEKYRRIRLSQDKVQRTIVDVPNALDLLVTTGFVRSNDGEFLIFPKETTLHLANIAITLIQPLIQTSQPAQSAPASSSDSLAL